MSAELVGSLSLSSISIHPSIHRVSTIQFVTETSAVSPLSQPVLPGDDPERDPQSPGALHGHGAGRRAEPHPAAAGQRGVPLGRHRHQPAADLQGHPGTPALPAAASNGLNNFFCAQEVLLTAVSPNELEK